MSLVRLWLAVFAVLPAAAACSGGGDGKAPRPARIQLGFEDNLPTEEVPRPIRFQVVDTHGAVVDSWSGTLALSAERGPVSPATVDVVDGDVLADVTFEVAGENRLFVTADASEGLPGASQYFYPLARAPIRDVGPLTGGAILVAGTGWDAVGVRSPAVIVEGTTTRLWYASAVASSNGNIGLAESADGMAFTRVGPVLGPLVSGDACHADGADAPAIIEDGGGYVMIYAGRTAGRRHLCRATSSDGVTWTVTPGLVEDGAVLAAASGADRFDNAGIRGGALARIDADTLLLAYAADGIAEITLNHEGPETISGIGLATSADGGLTWAIVDGVGPAFSHFSGFLEAQAGEAWDAYQQFGPGLLRDGPVFRMWLTGVSDGGHRIGYRASANPLEWGPHVDNLENPYHEIVTIGPAGSFDAAGVGWPCVVESNSVRRLFYSGLGEDAQFRIGTAHF